MPLFVNPYTAKGLDFVARGYQHIYATGADVAHTGTTSPTTLHTLTLDAGTIGPRGSVEWWLLWTVNNSAGTKNLKINFGGTDIYDLTLTTVTMNSRYGFGMNRNSESSQIWFTSAANASGLGNSVAFTTAVNTGASVTITTTATLSNSADTLTFRGLHFNILK